MADSELDLRQLREPDQYPTVFARYAELPVGDAFVVVADRDPARLHEEFELEHPDSHSWEYREQGPSVWRVRIGKLAGTPLPRVLVNTAELIGDSTDSTDPAAQPASDTAGAVWKLRSRARDLDSNVIALPAAGTIDEHVGPDLDVLIHVLAGSGELGTELGVVELVPGAVVWLPRRSRRRFRAGPDGLRYLTVHQRRRALVLAAPQSSAI
ncbi:DUF2249 domain-containing protein [Actinoalloteichus hymeniacidonis]|uniref:DUF2249 domain-containing protein n=1 Tax=Actinoalloteichus hymeniacidonis TaxID=340345 RepID=A0AAC9HN47_9PSEU|nr:DUF2249 domain-containing protein [Actinoalloteichus hymeniacidonis]AOS62242.1 hypothetical protein TL08_07110 [Actinoalloteichus hymeniacidonis]MBB5909732.1 uncharacterized protein (DUF2249 family)/quercetin dioxygenase-like cupin family protein [Actinoalloteichus hymeniacidonis]